MPSLLSHESDSVARILEAAKTLFAERGFDAASVNTIAEAAGVSKANVFHHFKSKNALYLAAVRSGCDTFCNEIERLGSDDGPFEQRLRRYAGEHLAHVLENGPLTRLILRDLLEAGERRGQEFAEQVFGQNFARLVEILRQGQARGELRDDSDPAMVAILIIGIGITFFQSREAFRHFPDVDFADRPADYSRMAMDILLHGLLPRDDRTREDRT